MLAGAGGADAIYILGDLAEVWVGDDDDSACANALREALGAAAARRPVFVMRGNRDFLLGDRFAADTGVALIPDPSVIDVDGQRVLVAHGDAYCTRDVAYQRARVQLRSPQWRARVLTKPLAERRTLAARLRAESAAAGANKAAHIMDVTPAAAAAALTAADAPLLVHGHTHRPAIHDLGDGRRRIVLGDWQRCGWRLTLRRGDAALTCFALRDPKP